MSVSDLRERITRMFRLASRGAFMAALASLLLATLTSVSAADPARTTDPAALATLLKSGGLIMYVRHAATNHDEADESVSDLRRCDLQRNISEQGK